MRFRCSLSRIDRECSLANSVLDRCQEEVYTERVDGCNPNSLPMTLTKRDLVIRISEETGLIQQQVLVVVQKTLDYIAEALAKGDKVELRNFGVFEVKVRKARIGRNPNAPATDVPIPERSVVKFKPGKEMRGEVIKIPPKTPPQSPQPAT
jgi:nucleoid DNA-binding protein